ncbi:MAG: hypothetical protein DMG98_23040 [Acidobacteria bacterium]|nr:MAG: hypothetical protein DMG98_23040 [Acidobacteriota bacterium]
MPRHLPIRGPACQHLRRSVIAAKLEADGDIHSALQDATGDNPGIVVCEDAEKAATLAILSGIICQ